MQETIKKVCEELTEFLLAKNKAYGDSASNPVRIFSKAGPLDQLDIRIDDKLSRIARGNEFDGDDTELDLIGYLVLKRAIKRKEEKTLRREAPGRSGYQMVEPKECIQEVGPILCCAHSRTAAISPAENYGATMQCLDCGGMLHPYK